MLLVWEGMVLRHVIPIVRTAERKGLRGLQGAMGASLRSMGVFYDLTWYVLAAYDTRNALFWSELRRQSYRCIPTL